MRLRRARADRPIVRMLLGAIEDWPKVFKICYEHLNPGGYIECIEREFVHRNFEAPPARFTRPIITGRHDLQEAVTAMKENGETTSNGATKPGNEEGLSVGDEGNKCATYYLEKWREVLVEAADSIGRSFDVAKKLKPRMEDVGFQNVVEVVQKCPQGPWPKKGRMKDIGTFSQQQMIDATKVYGRAHLTRISGWTNEEYEQLMRHCLRDIMDPALKLYANQ